MDGGRFSIQRMKLRAFDLSERTAHAGRVSVEQRLERLRTRSFMIAQAAVTAGLAWLLASVLIEPRPFFAPVAAIITLGFSFGRRWRRGLEVAVGVFVGVGIGVLFVNVLGNGSWQVALVCLIAMVIAVLLGAGTLMTTQAGVQAIIAIALPGAGFDRWLDALVGCALALLVATVAPIAPVRKPGTLAAGFLQEVAHTLRATVTTLRDGDTEGAESVLDRARQGEESLEEMESAATEGVAVVRQSPFLRGRLPQVRAYADLYPPLDRLSRNLRVLVRRSVTALWRSEPVEPSNLDLIEQLAEVIDFMAGELYEHRLPTAARKRLIAVAEASADAGMPQSLSAVVVLAQARSMIVDLLELTGLTFTEARELVPEMLD